LNREQFTAALRTALMQLDDLQSLRRSPLLTILAGDRNAANPVSLQRLLFKEIESLKHAPGVRPSRMYEILYYRYVEQISQKEVAYQLGISVRQLRREQANAIEYLADHLWNRYNLTERSSEATREEIAPSPSSAQGTGLNEEIAWLRDGFRSEASVLSAELAEALRDAAILAKRYGVTLRQAPIPALPKVAVPPMALRQALLTALTAVIPPTTGLSLDIQVASSETGATITLQQAAIPSKSPPQPSYDLASLDVVSTLIAPFGGHVIASDIPPLRVQIVVPKVGSIPVLVVDDNPDARQLLERYAANSRFRVIATADCAQVVALARKFGVHAIVLDVMMPGVDGWDILAQLRHHPDTQNIPIIVCTILPQEELANLLGATAFIQKPVSQQAFLEALERVTATPERGNG